MQDQLIEFSTAKLAKEKGFSINRKNDKNYDNYEPNRMTYNWNQVSNNYVLLGDFYKDINQNYQ